MLIAFINRQNAPSSAGNSELHLSHLQCVLGAMKGQEKFGLVLCSFWWCTIRHHWGSSPETRALFQQSSFTALSRSAALFSSDQPYHVLVGGGQAA